jgi:hypothetical protein
MSDDAMKKIYEAFDKVGLQAAEVLTTKEPLQSRINRMRTDLAQEMSRIFEQELNNVTSKNS